MHYYTRRSGEMVFTTFLFYRFTRLSAFLAGGTISFPPHVSVYLAPLSTAMTVSTLFRIHGCIIHGANFITRRRIGLYLPYKLTMDRGGSYTSHPMSNPCTANASGDYTRTALRCSALPQCHVALTRHCRTDYSDPS